MTYLEKLLGMVKINRELLDEQKVKKLTQYFERYIPSDFCPSEFFIGAPGPDTNQRCLFHRTCKDCWDQEATQ